MVYLEYNMQSKPEPMDTVEVKTKLFTKFDWHKMPF